MRHYFHHSDVQLVLLLKDSDSAAFTEIYHRYWDKLLYIAGKKLGNLSEAESIVQDVLLDLWQRRETIHLRGALDGYLVVAVKYRMLNHLARSARARTYRQSAGSPETLLDHSTEQWLRFEELQHWLEATVARLPEKCRLAYRLREDGLSQKEIALAMQVSEKTVETHVARALKAIRKGISEFLTFLT